MLAVFDILVWFKGYYRVKKYFSTSAPLSKFALWVKFDISLFVYFVHQATFVFLSSFSTLLIAIDRYLFIVHPGAIQISSTTAVMSYLSKIWILVLQIVWYNKVYSHYVLDGYTNDTKTNSYWGKTAWYLLLNLGQKQSLSQRVQNRTISFLV